MKTKLTYSLLAAAAACGMAQGQGQTTAYTTPVGYTTQTLDANKYNLVAITLHNSAVFGGVITGANSTSVSFTGVDFTTLLAAGTVYILELPNGVTQEISTWTATSLTTPENISSSVVAGTTTCKIRKASTVSDIFGATNSLGLASDGDEDLSNNDVLLVPNVNNAFDTVYYFDNGETTGWFDDQGNEANNKVLNYGDGFFVQRIAGGQSINLVISGEVKKTPTSSVLVSGFNFVGSVSPVGLTLSNSGLQNFLNIATNEAEATTTADFVLQQQSNGTYRTAYYFNDGETVGWFDDQGETADNLILDTGCLIQNKGASKSVTLSVPSSYSSL
jgi:hypothetical protein